MTPVMGWLLAISFLDTGKYLEVQQIGGVECRMEKEHLQAHNTHLKLQCAYRSEPPVEIDYD